MGITPIPSCDHERTCKNTYRKYCIDCKQSWCDPSFGDCTYPDRTHTLVFENDNITRKEFPMTRRDKIIEKVAIFGMLADISLFSYAVIFSAYIKHFI
jgi:hypothetical protein